MREVGEGQAEIDSPAPAGNVGLCNWIVVGVCLISMLANLLYAMIRLRYGEEYMIGL